MSEQFSPDEYVLRSIYIDPHDDETLREIAQRENMDLSVLIRVAISAGIDMIKNTKLTLDPVVVMENLIFEAIQNGHDTPNSLIEKFTPMGYSREEILAAVWRMADDNELKFTSTRRIRAIKRNEA